MPEADPRMHPYRCVAIALAAACLLAAPTFAGEPQCPPGVGSCYYSYSNGAFGDPFFSVDDAELPYNETITGEVKTHSCSRFNWLMREQCHVHCPLRLEVVAPAEYRTRICVEDNVFTPYSLEGHLDLNHPINGKEMEIIAPPEGPRRLGCRASDYAADDGAGGSLNFTDRIVLNRRGGCYFFQKFNQMKSAHAAAGVMVNSKITNNFDEQLQLMSGSTAEIRFPAVAMSRQMGDVLFEALDAGVTLIGKLQLNCDPMPPADVDTPLYDGCPDLKLRDVCNDAADDADRLCAKCPLELQVSGDGDGPAAAVCLWGHALLPRQEANSLQHVLELPFPFAPDALVWIDALPAGGCGPRDYDGLADKYLLVREPTACTAYQAVRFASAAGVAGVISIAATAGQDATFVGGASEFVHIPVHGVGADEARGIDAAARGSGIPFTLVNGARGYIITAPAMLFEGTWAPRPGVAVSDIAYDEAREDAAGGDGIQFSSMMIGCLVLMVVFAVGSVLLYRRQRRRRVVVPDEAGVTSVGFEVPLGVASTGVSLTLLVIIAGVAFSLAHAAGHDAREAAIADGEYATTTTFENAVDNLNDLSLQLRSAVLSDVEHGISAVIKQGEAAADGAAALLMGVDSVPTWNTFAPNIPQFMNYANSMAAEGWRVHVFTKNGFVASLNFLTDDRPDAERRDGVNGSVAETNEGWRYGTHYLMYLEEKHVHSVLSTHSGYEYNISEMYAGGVGDPLAVTRGRARSMSVWRAARGTFPITVSGYFLQPLTVFVPYYNRENQWVGTVDAQMDMNSLGRLLADAVNPTALENMTVAVFDFNEKSIIACNRHRSAKRRGTVWRVLHRGMYELYSMYHMPVVEIVAGAQYLRSTLGGKADHHASGTEEPSKDPSLPVFRTGGPPPREWRKDDISDAGFHGVYDQAAWYGEPANTIMDIRVRNGAPVDVGGDANDAVIEHLDGTPCTAGCTATQAGGDEAEAMRFNGDTVLLISKVITPRTPRVAATRDPDAPLGSPWKSTAPEYDQLMRIRDDGVDTLTEDNSCVAFTHYVTNDVGLVNGVTKCLMREAWMGDPFTLHVVIKPDAHIPAKRSGVDTPVLFSDVRSGETSFRVYANGAVYMNMFVYGCRTNALAGGIPGGVWTTITAVRSTSSCAVYVNGTLVEESTIARAYRFNFEAEPYRVGEGFEGFIESVGVYNLSLDAAEVMRLHATGRAARSVSSRQWYVDVRKLNEDRQRTREGVGWGILALLPRDDVMRQVDENDRATMAELRARQEATHREHAQRTRETIMVMVLIALLSMLVFLVFNDALTRPVAETAVVMTDAAVMRVDDIDTSRGFLQEINTMRRAMALMCKNLKEYRSYMPHTLMLSDSENNVSDDEGTASQASGGSQIGKSDGPSTATGITDVRGSSLVARSEGRSTLAARSVVAAVQSRCAMTLALMRKKMSFAIMNVNDWLPHIAAMGDREVVHMHGELLSIALTGFAASKGVAEVFSGDRFIASFNAVRACSTHRTAACTAALLIRSELRMKAPKMTATIACVSGDGRAGNCGNEHMKKFTFMTPVLSWGIGLERVARVHGVSIAADAFIYDDVSVSFLFKIAFDVIFPKRLKARPVRVAEIVDHKSCTGAAEWLYELHEAAERDPYAAWNSFADAVLGQDWDNAERREAAAAVIDSGAMFMHLKEQLDQKMAQPIVLKYH